MRAEPPAPTPSATTYPTPRAGCANCGCTHPPRQRGRTHAATCSEHGCNRYTPLPVPPASAPAATAGTETKPACTCGDTLTHLRTCYWYDPPHRGARPAAPSGEEAEPTPEDVEAVAKMLDQMLRDAVQCGRGVMLSWENAKGFSLVLHEVSRRLTAQATELAALRARVEEQDALLRRVLGWYHYGAEWWAAIEADIRAALAPRQTTAGATLEDRS